MKKNIEKVTIDNQTSEIIGTASNDEKVCIAVCHDVETDTTAPEVIPTVIADAETSANGAKWQEYLENDCQFYPTPEKLAHDLASLIDWTRVKTVLEPSAGKGDLVNAVISLTKSIDGTGADGKPWHVKHRVFKGEFDCVEIAPELCAILESKGFHVENVDFLEWDCIKYYDAIIMNPPFNQAEKHLLKALDILKNGGQLAAIVNAETLANPCNVYRKDLVAKLAEYHAEIEYIENAFSTAERKTNVRIAMIYVDIPKKVYGYDYFAEMDKSHEYRTENRQAAENTELATNDIIDNLIHDYKNESQASLYVLRHFGNVSALVPELVLCYKSHGLSDYAVEPNRLLKNIRLKYWKKLFMSNKIGSKLTEASRENFREKVDTFGEYDFTIKNIYKLLGELSENLAVDIEKSIINLWDNLTFHSSMYKNSNIHYYNGWKTNDAYKIGDKIVWNICAGSAYDRKKYIYWHSNFIERLDELDKILQYLNGGKRSTPDTRSILDIFRDSVPGECYQGEKIEFPFFTAIFYKKGTAHITFKCPELIKKWNIFAGKKHNFLPNDYGNKYYDDLNKSEKKVADSFDGGKEGYAETHKNYNFYSGKVSVLMIGTNEMSETSAPIQAVKESETKVSEIIAFEIGEKYCYKKSDFIQITSRDENKVKFTTSGKEFEKAVSVFDGVEVIKNSRGVSLCWANKKYIAPMPTPNKPEENAAEIQTEQKEEIPEIKTESAVTPVDEKQEKTGNAPENQTPETPETELKVPDHNIMINLYNSDGEKTGEMYADYRKLMQGDFRQWLDLARESDKHGETQAVNTLLQNALYFLNAKDYTGIDKKQEKARIMAINPELLPPERKLKIKKNQAFVKIVSENGVFWPVVYVGDKVEVPATDTAPGFTAYIANAKYGKKFDVFEATTGASIRQFATLKAIKTLLIDDSTCTLVKDNIASQKNELRRKIVAEFMAGLVPKETALDSIPEELDDFQKMLATEFVNNIYRNANKPTEPPAIDKPETIQEAPKDVITRVEFKDESGKVIDAYQGKNKTKSELVHDCLEKRGMLGEKMPNYTEIEYTKENEKAMQAPNSTLWENIEFEPIDDLPDPETMLDSLETLDDLPEIPEIETPQEIPEEIHAPTTDTPQAGTKPKRRPKGEKSHCIATAGDKSALETMINNYYCSKNYVIMPDLTVYNTKINATIDTCYIKVTPAGRWQFRKIDTPGAPEKARKAA